MIRVLLVDDQELVRTGFGMILGAQADIEVVGEAPDGHAAIAQASALTPDVILMDIRMPVMDGIEATRRIVAHAGIDARGVMLTTYDHDDEVLGALRAGASGFLFKDGPAAGLLNAVRTVAAGESLLSPAVTTRVIRSLAAQPAAAARPAVLDELTAREVEVLELVAEGLSSAEIAARLVVGDATVKTHVGRVSHEARAPRPRAGGPVRLQVRPGHARRRRCPAAGLTRPADQPVSRCERRAPPGP